MSTATAKTQNQQNQQKSKRPYVHTTRPYQPPTESMIEAARIDYATRLFMHTQKQLQEVYSSPSKMTTPPSSKERKNPRNDVKDYGEVRDQKVKKAHNRNW